MMGLFWNTLRINKKRGGVLTSGAFLTVTLSEVCPIKCDYCPLWIDRDNWPTFDKCSIEEWKEFLEGFPEWVSLIAICGGEPSLVPYISDIANWLLKRGHHVLIYSNLLRPDRLEEINHSYRLTIQATYHSGDDAKRYDAAYRRLKRNGYNIFSFELESPLVHPYSKKKPFLSVEDIKGLTSFHCAPDAPRTKIIYRGAENLYR